MNWQWLVLAHCPDVWILILHPIVEKRMSAHDHGSMQFYF